MPTTERDRLFENLTDEIRRLRQGESPDLSQLRRLVEDRTVQVAEVLADLDDEDRRALFDALEPDQQAALLEEADEPMQEVLLAALADDERRAAILDEMAVDDVADIVDDLSEQHREQVLEGMDTARAEVVRELARYDPDTAGGLMTTELLAVEEGTTVQEVKDIIRSSERPIESIDNIFVVRNKQLVGVFSARDLLLAENTDSVSEFMTTKVISVDVDDDAEECFRIMEKHHLSSVPVVDEFHDLAGMITVDDVLTAVEREASEDVFRIAGSSELYPTRDSIVERVRKRLPYLLVSIVGGFGGAAVMKLIEGVGATEKLFFMPFVAGLAGNIAQQSSAVMVRGFATGVVEPSRVTRVIVDEMRVGLLAGLICATLGALLASLIGSDESWRLSLAVLCSVTMVATLAPVLGTAIPSVLHRLGKDPAIAAGPFITMLLDMTSIAIYLTIVNRLL